LRQINEDDHDLRSGRPMREFEFPSKVTWFFIMIT
jgi:splicing suppressor protein 51